MAYHHFADQLDRAIEDCRAQLAVDLVYVKECAAHFGRAAESIPRIASATKAISNLRHQGRAIHRPQYQATTISKAHVAQPDGTQHATGLVQTFLADQAPIDHENRLEVSLAHEKLRTCSEASQDLWGLSLGRPGLGSNADLLSNGEVDRATNVAPLTEPLPTDQFVGNSSIRQSEVLSNPCVVTSSGAREYASVAAEEEHEDIIVPVNPHLSLPQNDDEERPTSPLVPGSMQEPASKIIDNAPLEPDEMSVADDVPWHDISTSVHSPNRHGIGIHRWFGYRWVARGLKVAHSHVSWWWALMIVVGLACILSPARDVNLTCCTVV